MGQLRADSLGDCLRSSAIKGPHIFPLSRTMFVITKEDDTKVNYVLFRFLFLRYSCISRCFSDVQDVLQLVFVMHEQVKLKTRRNIFEILRENMDIQNI